MKIVVDSEYCVVRVECDEETKDSHISINIKNEPKLAECRNEKVEA